jgi:hypothetical protein
MSDQDRYKYHGEGEVVSDPGNRQVPLVADGETFDPPKYVRVRGSGDVTWQGSGDNAPEYFGPVVTGETLWFRPVLLDPETTADLLGIY